MKRIILAFALLVAAAPALAGSWTVVTTTGQDTKFDRDRVKLNKATCQTYGLPGSCTQNQARAAFCAQPGASSSTPPCTLNGGLASGNIRVYVDVGDYFDFVVKDYLAIRKLAQDADDLGVWTSTLAGASQAQKDAACTSIGLTAGCLP